MMYPDPASVTRIASLGGGPIGGGWAAHFLARGYDVTAYLHDPSEQEAFHLIVQTGWKCLTELGLAPGAALERLRVVTDFEEALDGAQETMLGVSLGYAVSVLPVLLYYKG